MQKVSGCAGVLPIECVNPKKDKWHVRWNIVENGDGGAEYMEEVFLHKPTVDEIKQTITNWFNENIDQAILSGYQWRDMQVWLSAANQLNYKVAYDKAVATNGASLPVTFKFGTDEAPVYHEFATLDELEEFYDGYTGYIQSVITQGWKDKDNIDLAIYQV